MANSYNFNGLGLGLGNLSRLSNAKTRSISAENFTGEKGRGGMASEGTGAKAARDLWRRRGSMARELWRGDQSYAGEVADR